MKNSTRYRHYFLCLTLALWFCPLSLAAQTVCAEIDFETVPGDSIYEGYVIDTQFMASLGIFFVLENGTSPRLAEPGNPTTAFQSSFGGDTPAPEQGIGNFFLTDDGQLSGSSSPPLIVHFSSAVDSASGVILDIDFTEAFTIQARGIMDSVLVDTTITAGSPGTGDGLATPWAFRRAQPDVYSIKFIGTRASGLFGLGFDNFVTCALDRPSATQNIARPPIVLFPNPSSGRLTARSPQARIRSLAVFDATGRLLEPVLRCDAHEVSLQLNHHGLALVEIVTDRGVVVRKVFFE